MLNSNTLLKNLWQNLVSNCDSAKVFVKVDKYVKLFQDSQFSQDGGTMLDVI